MAMPRCEQTAYNALSDAGMTEAEIECFRVSGELANLFAALPMLHQADMPEVCQAIHVIQDKLLLRPTYRKLLAVQLAPPDIK